MGYIFDQAKPNLSADAQGAALDTLVAIISAYHLCAWCTTRRRRPVEWGKNYNLNCLFYLAEATGGLEH